MYADRYARPGGVKPGSLTIALAVNAAFVAALLLSAPEVITRISDRPLTTVNIPIPPPPPPVPLPKTPQSAAQQHVFVPPSRVPEPTPIFTIPTFPDAPIPTIDPGAAPGSGTAVADPPPLAPPLLVDPAVDPRYASALQPTYPAEERRAEREGRVVVRVLIAVDGRVLRVEPVSATSDAFFRVTREQALARWRFRPGARDGVPVEAWRTMVVSFVLND